MEKDENIKFETMPNWGSMLTTPSEPVEKEYDSPYNELMDKVNPSNFSIETNGIDKFNTANEIYAQLISKGKDCSDRELIALRNQAIDELYIHISTKKKVEYLNQLLEPEFYINMKPYDKDLVAEVGRWYNMLINNKDNIRVLEHIESQIVGIIQRREEYDFAHLSLNEFIEKYPQSVYADSTEEECFNAMFASEYLKLYPQGKHAEEAHVFLKSYSVYLERYPNGRYKEMVVAQKKEDRRFAIVVIFAVVFVIVVILLKYIKES